MSRALLVLGVTSAVQCRQAINMDTITDDLEDETVESEDKTKDERESSARHLDGVDRMLYQCHIPGTYDSARSRRREPCHLLPVPSHCHRGSRLHY